MKVTVFTQMSRTYRPTTGVGRFLNNMILGLAHEPDFDVTLLTSRHYLDGQGQLDPRTPLRGLPLRTFPLRERLMERLWKATGFPKADRWCGNPDWLWATAESYVPVQHQKVLLTSYDMNQAEPVLSWMDNAPRQPYIRQFRYWYAKSLKQTRHVITISEHSKRRLCELFDVDPTKVTNVSCGVEQPYFDMASVDPASLTRPCPQPYLLVIGGLNARKGGTHILDVASALMRRKSDLQILIAGMNHEDLVQKAAALPNIRLLGFTPDEDLPALLRQASGLLFLSLYEGFGIPAAEAMALGTPAIVANNTSLPEVVGDAGFIVELDQPEQTAAIADRLVTDPAFRADYARRGRERALQMFTWDICVKRLRKVLETY